MKSNYTISQICEEYKPTSPNWEWSWKRLESVAAIELRGVYKGKVEAIIRTQFSLHLIANNPDKAQHYINLTVKKAEDEAVIIDTPLWNAMRENKE